MSNFEIDSADIFSEGYVRLYRQPNDRPFTPEGNIVNRIYALIGRRL